MTCRTRDDTGPRQDAREEDSEINIDYLESYLRKSPSEEKSFSGTRIRPQEGQDRFAYEKVVDERPDQDVSRQRSRSWEGQGRPVGERPKEDISRQSSKRRAKRGCLGTDVKKRNQEASWRGNRCKTVEVLPVIGKQSMVSWLEMRDQSSGLDVRWVVKFVYPRPEQSNVIGQCYQMVGKYPSSRDESWLSDEEHSPEDRRIERSQPDQMFGRS